MPTTLPVIRSELAASGTVTDWTLRTRFAQAAPGVVVPVTAGHDPAAFGGFGFDIVTRSWANHLRRPDAVLAGWSAAGVYGLKPDWADCAPVLLLCDRNHGGSVTSTKAAEHPRRPVIWPVPPGLETRTPCRRFPRMRVVTPQVAAAQCLWTVLTGRHTWWVHDVPGLTRETVRAVQFLDAFAQCTWVRRPEILASSAGLVDRRVVRKVLELSDGGAQSPMETVLRLMVRDLLPEPLRWQSQIRVDLAPGAAAGWSSQTIPDLGSRELKIAVYYDGGYHGSAARTGVDFDQYHALRDLGWEVLRFTNTSVRDPDKVRQQVAKAIARALTASDRHSGVV